MFFFLITGMIKHECATENKNHFNAQSLTNKNNIISLVLFTYVYLALKPDYTEE